MITTCGSGALQHQRRVGERLVHRALHLVGRRRVAGADLDLDARRDRRLGVVEDRLLRDDAVGNDQELAGLGAQLGGAPGDLLHLALAVAELHPVADAKRLLDLNREAGKQVAERVLQREADHHRADRRRRQQLLAQQHRADHDEERDDGDVLDDRREAIGRAILPPRIGDQRDGGVDDREDERQAREREQELDVAQPLPRGDLEQREAEEQPRRKLQPPADEATYGRPPSFLNAATSAAAIFTATSAGFDPPFASFSGSTPRAPPDAVTCACFFSPPPVGSILLKSEAALLRLLGLLLFGLLFFGLGVAAGQSGRARPRRSRSPSTAPA